MRVTSRYIVHAKKKKPREALNEAHFTNHKKTDQLETPVKKVDDGSGKGKYVDTYA